MKIKPLFDRVLILPQQKETTEFGLIIPQTAQEKPQIGRVVALGKNCNNKGNEAQLKIGDVVLYNKYAGSNLKLENDTYILICEQDILGVVYE